MEKNIRVLIVDDSTIACEMLTSIINDEPNMSVIGVADSGKKAIELNSKLHPDIITMDIQMPGLDGFTATEEIMCVNPVPILVVTSVPMVDGIDQTYRAIQAGALDLVKKPEFDSEDIRAMLTKIRILSKVRVVRHKMTPFQFKPIHIKPIRPMVEVIAIAASTGGPRALCELLKNLPRSFRAGILLTQHLPDGFTAGFARWLDHELALDVEEAVSGQMVHPGKVLLAPSQYHLTVKPPGVIFLSNAPPDENLRPSANPMFQSVAKVYGSRSIGVILTGMGEDGARGLLALHRAGGLCIAQDEASSIIFGMPNVAIKLGAVDHVLNISEISNMLLSHVSKFI